MKYLFLIALFCSSLLLTNTFAQEKFLEVNTLLLNAKGKKVKNYELSISTSEGVSFNTKVKKKISFYLPPGEIYTLTFLKDTLTNDAVTIDLKDVPKNMYSAKLFLDLRLNIYKQEKIKYSFEERYGRVIPG